jgi:two-component system nitrogen regulation response regulator NtrX
VVIRRAMETSRLRRENHELKRREVGPAEMIGSSAAFKRAERASSTRSRSRTAG